MIKFKKKGDIYSRRMRGNVFNIVIVSILIIVFTTTDHAFGADLFLTPYDEENPVLFRNHALIIDIDDPAASDPIQVKIQVISDSEQNPDLEELEVYLDPEWGMYRVVIIAKEGSPNSGDSIIQARDGDEIQVEYMGTDSTEIKNVNFKTINDSEEPIGKRWTYDDILYPDCLDVDNDAVCDDWEDNNDGLVIFDPTGEITEQYTFDCSANGSECGSDKPDIFVEIDWIESHQPDPKAIKQIIDAFENARDAESNLNGIRLHIQVDPLPANTHLRDMAFPGADRDGFRGFDQLKGDDFGIASIEELNNPAWNETKKLKHQVFHYGLIAHRITGDNFKTGIGEIVGNDFLMTLGKYTGKTGSTDQQSGTLMHELGHNLGLNHGGGEFDETQNKPNLFSVMTYARQFADLDSNRKLDFSNATLGHHHTSPFFNPPKTYWAPVWSLNETAIQGYGKGIFTYTGHETEVILFSCPDGQVGAPIYLTGRSSNGVDWDCDGDSTTKGKFVLNVNNFSSAPNSDFSLLEGHNDWAALNFTFSSNISNYGDGLNRDVTTGELTFEKVTLNRISNILSLYRQIDMFDEADFESEFSLGSKLLMSATNSRIFGTQSSIEMEKNSNKLIAYSIKEPSTQKIFVDHATANVSVPQGTSVPGCEETNECFLPYEVAVDVGGVVTWSNDDTAAHTVTSGSAEKGGLSGEFDSSLFMAGTTFSHTFESAGEFPYYCMVHPWMTGKVVVGTTEPDEKKDSFKKAVRSTITLINHHEIQNTKTAVQIIDKALKNSLSHNYDKIQPLTLNLIGTYDKALGFGTVSTDDPEIEPIVEERKIATMIKVVEDFVDKVKTIGPQCGVDFVKTEKGCECPPGFVENDESDCIYMVYPPPVKQTAKGTPANEVQCNIGLQLILDTIHDRPACVENESVTKLVERGWVSSQK